MFYILKQQEAERLSVHLFSFLSPLIRLQSKSLNEQVWNAAPGRRRGRNRGRVKRRRVARQRPVSDHVCGFTSRLQRSSKHQMSETLEGIEPLPDESSRTDDVDASRQRSKVREIRENAAWVQSGPLWSASPNGIGSFACAQPQQNSRQQRPASMRRVSFSHRYC